jgi:hypothetical protein
MCLVVSGKGFRLQGMCCDSCDADKGWAVVLWTQEVPFGDAKRSPASSGSWVVWALSGVCTIQSIGLCVDWQAAEACVL